MNIFSWPRLGTLPPHFERLRSSLPEKLAAVIYFKIGKLSFKKQYRPLKGF